MDQASHENAKRDSHEQTGAQGFTGHPVAAGAEREGGADANRGNNREAKNQRKREHRVCERTCSQGDYTNMANHDRVRPPHEHLADVASNDRRSQRKRCDGSRIVIGQ